MSTTNSTQVKHFTYKGYTFRDNEETLRHEWQGWNKSAKGREDEIPVLTFEEWLMMEDNWDAPLLDDTEPETSRAEEVWNEINETENLIADLSSTQVKDAISLQVRVSKHMDNEDVVLRNSDNEIIANLSIDRWDNSENEAIKVGKQIEKCVNSHDELVKALQAVLDYEKRGADKGEPRIGNGILSIVKNALTKAKQ